MDNPNIDRLKVHLIAQISTLSNEETLRQLERLARPMPKKLDIDALIAQRDFKGIDRAKFDRLIRKINIKEPLEQLLAVV